MNFTRKNPVIYVLSGKAGNGKNKIAELIKDIYEEKGAKTINLAYASYLKEYAKNILAWDGSEETKPREFLQEIGISLIKNNIDASMLINRTLEDIEVYSYFYDVITISDARFTDEIEEVRKNFKNVIVIHVFGKENNLTDEQRKHITETALDSYNDYDYEIDNSKSLEELKNNIERIIEEVENYE